MGELNCMTLTRYTNKTFCESITLVALSSGHVTVSYNLKIRRLEITQFQLRADCNQFDSRASNSSIMLPALKGSLKWSPWVLI